LIINLRINKTVIKGRRKKKKNWSWNNKKYFSDTRVKILKKKVDWREIAQHLSSCVTLEKRRCSGTSNDTMERAFYITERRSTRRSKCIGVF
jgi:hypothetical protein